MRKSAGLLCIVGFPGLFACVQAGYPTTNAKAPTTAVTEFDGKYEFISATGLNETWNIGGGLIGRCRGFKGTPLTIQNGQVRYFNRTGTVGPQGDLTMRYTAPRKGGGFDQRYVVGSIDNAGTIRARRITELCSQDIIYRRT